MSRKPLVTVYMPTFNRLELLKRAVDSVLSQDYENIELIVVDDGSSDGTVAYLAELAKFEPTLRYFVNETNSGACVSRNKAIAEARGEFITGLDDDDYFLPNRISSFVQAWDARQANIIALFADSFFEKPGGKKTLSKRKRLVGKSCLYERNQIGNQVFLPTAAIRMIGGFDESLPAWQDYDCWFRLFRAPEDRIQLVPVPSYVTDTSHDHQRIGMSSRDKKLRAFNIIRKKLDVSGRELDSMKVVFYDSAQIAPPISLVLSKIIFRMNVQNAGLALKVLLKSMIYKWPSFKVAFDENRI